jgi:hypothetical protein
MGVLDVPAPLFAWADALMSQFAPSTARLVLWGLVSAVVSMGLYWLLSPQRKIAQVKESALQARRALDSYEGDFAGAWPRMREMLRLSLKQVGIVTWPAIAASLPVLCLLVWMSTAYGYHFPPPNSDVEIRTAPEQIGARWIGRGEQYRGPDAGPNAPHIELHNERSTTVLVIPMPKPVPTVHKRQWWNALLGNPAGYIPDDAPISRVDVDLPSQQFLSVGPSWMRSWEFLYFTVLILGSVIIKVVFQIK